jgi:hypothetical protein
VIGKFLAFLISNPINPQQASTAIHTIYHLSASQILSQAFVNKARKCVLSVVSLDFLRRFRMWLRMVCASSGVRQTSSCFTPSEDGSFLTSRSWFPLCDLFASPSHRHVSVFSRCSTSTIVRSKTQSGDSDEAEVRGGIASVRKQSQQPKIDVRRC